MLSPRPTEPLDRLLVPDGTTLPLDVLACFPPVLPPQARCDPVTWIAVRVRCDERWREHRGPIGDNVRLLAADGRIRLGENGVLLDPATGQALRQMPGPCERGEARR